MNGEGEQGGDRDNFPLVQELEQILRIGHKMAKLT